MLKIQEICIVSIEEYDFNDTTLAYKIRTVDWNSFSMLEWEFEIVNTINV